MKLSLCMIVKNEAQVLARCLESVKAVVDELVVIDTGSTDDTVAIAQSFGATVQHFTWCHDFSAARNAALNYVSGDWILVLDADEVLQADIVPKLRQAMAQENALVINLVRQEVGAVQSPYSLVSRLFRRHPDVYFSRPYHAMVDDSVAHLLQREPHWQIIDLADVAILHYGYEPGAIAQRDKLQNAKATMETFWQHHPDDPYVCSKLGALYVQMGDVSRGIDLLKQGLAATSAKSMSQLDAPVLYELYYHLGIAHSRVQQFEQAEHHYRAAIAQPILESLKLGAYNNLGSLLKARGDLAGAKSAFETVLAIDPNFAIGHYNLGMALKGLGRTNDAVTHYQKAIALNPKHAEAHQNLGVVLLKLGQVPESLASFGRAIGLHEKNNPAEAQRLRQSLQGMGFQV